ncbi:Multiple epidermal growth factor-like domains protein 11 [Leptotrombidium deliense]|uniref:Multiple epidermal growth factor-like domains protein 11 n=1 Tax=Leptotrombidium deliense TaxID=299467 RepID=A0A443SKY4_9ACAR|nr:Multiple epidermal growth factor-like domains protein 11 [Leptotrombidium deliense]
MTHSLNILTACQDGKWGRSCEKTCNCSNGGRCDAETGKCICPPGTIGSDCVYACDCRNDGLCEKHTGQCLCSEGYLGSKCESQCPKGKFGKSCAFVCECDSSTSECSHITGECFCHAGYSGKKCDIKNCTLLKDADCSSNTLYLASSPVEEKSNGFVLIACICSLSLIILIISIFALLKYKQRVHQLKHELAYVTYIADKPKDTFNNPVYDCQPETSAKQMNAAPLNLNITAGLKTIKNDLDCKNNIQKAKLNMSDDEYFGACGGLSDDLSHKEANLNANIYHNIDDLKSYKEPLYDEIKLKGVDEENDNYDHLEYDRPRTLVRPNYDYIDNLKQV